VQVLRSVVSLVTKIAREQPGLVDEIAADVGEAAATVRPAIARHVELIVAVASVAGGVTPLDDPAVAAVLDRLRGDAAMAARSGVALARLLDHHLSTGWVLWASATRRPDAGSALAGLGTALLRAGDLAAAAIAEGFGEVDRERAARSAAALRELVGELLEPPDDDPARPARLARAAVAAGLDPSRPVVVTVAWLGLEVGDADPRVGRIARLLARPVRAAAAPGAGPTDPLPVVATRRGRVVVVDAADRATDARLTDALEEVAPEGWTAVAAEPASRLADVAATASDAMAALALAVRLPEVRRVRRVGEMALERALLADEALLRAALAAELGLLEGVPRTGGELVETLESYLAAGMRVTAAARRLHVAPRTVAYRLARIEEVRGAPLDAEAWRRYAVLLEARRLLAEVVPGASGQPASSGQTGSPGQTGS
jgi:hypothetical protein